MIEYFNNFADHLTKLARVPTAVKQYRRARQALAEAGEGSKNVFHGTSPEGLQSILASGKIRVAPGTHGEGAYMWKNRPRQNYMNTPDERSPGLMLRRSKLGPIKSPKDPSPHLKDRKAMLISDKDVKLHRKATAKGTAEQLKRGREGLKKGKVRQINSAIFNRAEADDAIMRAGEDVIAPTKRELVRLLQGKSKAPKFRFVRSRPGTKESEEFIDDYYDKLL